MVILHCSFRKCLHPRFGTKIQYYISHGPSSGSCISPGQRPLKLKSLISVHIHAFDSRPKLSLQLSTRIRLGKPKNLTHCIKLMYCEKATKN